MVWFITFIDDAKAQHIKERARKDEDFCLIIASLIFPRVAILRNDIVKFITPKTDDYFKLTGYSSTKKDNRERVEKALQDYHFIFPVVWKKAAAAADGAADDAANPKLEIKFQANRPFYSGPIIDTINEKFFSKPRCLGRKYKKLFKGPDSHPNEFEPQIPWWPLSLSTFEPDYTAGQVAVTLTPAGTPKHALKQQRRRRTSTPGAPQTVPCSRVSIYSLVPGNGTVFSVLGAFIASILSGNMIVCTMNVPMVYRGQRSKSRQATKQNFRKMLKNDAHLPHLGIPPG
ncbi:hypothetical protein R3P38DRAFT_3435573 [Favolaschia claudopus]|uniref:DUF6532 domain-containing protein n=1 Tax=Favolaschia claudopus TaxID=2862362 RepID=A0AAV9ZUU0_9AGAR